MKYLLVLFVVAIGIWLWRKNRQDEISERAAAPKPAAPRAVGAPQAMVRCAHCGLHLPATDALPGPDGALYCSVAHRRVAKG